MSLEEDLERRARRAPLENPHDVLDRARTQVGSATSTSRTHHPWLVAAALAAAVALTASAAMFLTEDGSSETVAGPDETTPSTDPDPATNGPPRSGQHCEGLRSETVWADSGHTNPLSVPAGRAVTYEETIVNDGDDTCTIVFEDCPAPGALYTVDGERLPGDLTVCDAAGHPPEEVPPGATRTETWTTPITHPPGSYELRVPQRDGTTAVLPVTATDALPACSAGEGELLTEPLFDQYVNRGDATFAQLGFAKTPDTCTIRLTEVMLALRPVDAAGQQTAPSELTNSARRWYTSGPRAGAFFETTFPPVELQDGQYEGELTVTLENGSTFSKPARLLVGDPTGTDRSAPAQRGLTGRPGESAKDLAERIMDEVFDDPAVTTAVDNPDRATEVVTLETDDGGIVEATVLNAPDGTKRLERISSPGFDVRVEGSAYVETPVSGLLTITGYDGQLNQPGEVMVDSEAIEAAGTAGPFSLVESSWLAMQLVLTEGGPTLYYLAPR